MTRNTNGTPTTSAGVAEVFDFDGISLGWSYREILSTMLRVTSLSVRL